VDEPGQWRFEPARGQARHRLRRENTLQSPPHPEISAAKRASARRSFSCCWAVVDGRIIADALVEVRIRTEMSASVRKFGSDFSAGIPGHTGVCQD
jgi:hypothetical protein